MEEANNFFEILVGDLSEATTATEKDELTFGVFSKLNEDAAFRKEVEDYAASAHEKIEVPSANTDVENPAPRESGFQMIWHFPLLYEWACHAIFFALIHQQLVESVFSKYDTCTRKHDSRELDLVRLGQFRSAQSRKVERSDATNEEIRTAGNKAIEVAKAARRAAAIAVPNERQIRKRSHDAIKYLQDANDKAKYGSAWQVRSVVEGWPGPEPEEDDEEDDMSDELSSDGEE